MKVMTFLSFVFLVALVAGCGSEANRTVTDGVDQQAIADYEAELAKVTSQEIVEE
ncbi:hypothetical protein [Novipirellula artificiosorum]|uniref:Secreted protein n=1 Tax=Novipirellula artificiosorum TaxID=2528016 RepID=A0A5C6DX59_9BACT|nr:hypothetical protein [Novipirellula artificiosorum]TWU39606.1 hypothetical protein Poly41_24610 [Novipirellula artificiosorum]